MKTKLLSLFFILLVCHISAQSPCNNMDFEATASGSYAGASNSLNIAGWTVSNSSVVNCSTNTSWQPGSPEIAIMNTPILNVTTIGNILQSPLGGSVVACLNSGTFNYSATRLSRKHVVTSANSYFQFAHAGTYNYNGNHSCCEQPKFLVQISDTLGQLITCLNEDYSSCNAGNSFTMTNGIAWNNWKLKNIDLSPLIGTTIRINIISQDCNSGGHNGITYFDAVCGPSNANFGCNCNQVGPYSPVSFCAGSGIAQIQGPLGYQTYSWTAPSGFSIAPGQATLSAITITNPTAGAVFSVQVTNGVCQYQIPYTLTNSTINIAGLGITPSCEFNANGSATVVANGSASGYTYVWTNNTSSVVSTASVVSNLAPGMYSVQVSSAACGTTNLALTVPNAAAQTKYITQYYCTGQGAFLKANAGSNYQWFSNGNVISGATAQGYTVTSPSNGGIYMLSYNNSQGCRDSSVYTVQQTIAGSLNITAPLICAGSNNGQAVMSLTPATNSYSNNNIGYWAYSTGTSNPIYSSAISGSPFKTFTLVNLSANGTYSAGAFDGSCYYSTGLTIGTIAVLNFSVSASTFTTCSGSMIPAAVNFANSNPAGVSYLWQPNVFLLGNQNTFQSVLFTPTVALGSTSTIVYTVVVSQTTANCTTSKTLALTVANPLTPTITPISPVCSNDMPFLISASPAGGYFGGNNALSPPALFTPSLATIGNNTITYSHGSGTCIASASTSFVVIASPTISIAGDLFVCSPGSTTLSVTGASAYNWSTGGTGSNLILSPSSSTVVYVTGQNGNCTDSTSVQIQVAAMPNVSINGNTNSCAGSQVTLVANGASGYLWNNGNTSGALVVNPAQTTSYFVTGSNSSFCKDSASIVVNITPVPIIHISGNFSICPGETALLVATGASSYSWSTGATGGIISVLPSQTTQYVVTGINTPANCASSRSITVTVDECVGIAEQRNSITLIYPNPVSSLLTIEKNEVVTLKIYNELGMLVHKQKTEKGKNSISTADWTTGIYFISLEGDSGSQVFKIVKTE